MATPGPVGHRLTKLSPSWVSPSALSPFSCLLSASSLSACPHKPCTSLLSLLCTSQLHNAAVNPHLETSPESPPHSACPETPCTYHQDPPVHSSPATLQAARTLPNLRKLFSVHTWLPLWCSCSRWLLMLPAQLLQVTRLEISLGDGKHRDFF